MGKIGLQLYSVKELTEKDFLGTIKDVANAGYNGVEFAGYYNTSAKDLRKTLDDNGLQACGSHLSIDLLDKDLDGLIAYSQEIGSKYLICPAVWGDMVGSADAWKRTGERFQKIGEKIVKNGLLFGYHNHDFEFIQYGGKMAYDIMLEQTTPETLFIELDTYWVDYAGMNTAEFMMKYSDRIKLLHIKDRTSKEDKNNIEIGKGVIDVPSIIKAGKDLQVPWFIVEQEYFNKPMIPSITESAAYLRSII